MATAMAMALGACGGGGARSVELPVVPAGDFEADCVSLCTLATGEEHCTAVHADFCLASCRARTNGLPTACGQCLVDQGTPIAGFISSDEPYCDTGGAADITACATACDDAGAAGPSTELAALCELECAFYMQDPEPLACSEEGSADCLGQCQTAIAGEGRVCAQCLADQTIPSQTCINDDCDCEPFFDSDPSFGCETLCDDTGPT
jgi:hypothetical protein